MLFEMLEFDEGPCEFNRFLRHVDDNDDIQDTEILRTPLLIQ